MTYIEKAKQRYVTSRTDSQTILPIGKRQAEEFLVITAGGCLLSLNAGFINGATLLHSTYTATHVTGALTKSSLFLQEGNTVDFGFIILNVLGFILGSAICAITITKQSFHLCRSYLYVFAMGTALLLASFFISFYYPDSRNYVYCISVASGMQNAMTTSYSGNVLRTTHMTGTATDIGIVIGRILKGHYEDVWKLKLMVPMMLSFFLGGLLAGVAYDHLAEQHHILLINVGIFGGTGLLYLIYLVTAIVRFDLVEKKDDDSFCSSAYGEEGKETKGDVFSDNDDDAL